MPSIAVQRNDELGGAASVLVRQKRDHVRLEALLRELAAVTGTRAEEEVLNRIYRLVFSHAFAEEAVLWPVIRRVLPDGEELTLRVEQEHQEVNELVARLQDGAPGDPGRQEVLDRLVAVLREDVRDEEDVLLPALQEAVDVPRLRRLGIGWEALRRTAPTRPHPTVARRPPGNALSALPLSALDRSRDLMELGAHRGPARLAGAFGAGGAALARASRAVEGFAPFRLGEEPSTARSRRSASPAAGSD